MNSFPKKAYQKLQNRKETGTLRSLHLYKEGVDFISNDYLGIAKTLQTFHPKSAHAGATGSRLISGNSEMHESLEKQLAEFYGAESALLFNSGYAANQGLLSSIAQRGDTILYDEHIHASIRDGIRLSFAKSFAFKHNDLVDLKHKAKQSSGDVFVITEGLFSMHGNFCPLLEISNLCTENGWFLILDEAHSTGITSNPKGLHTTFPCPIFARIHTFGKALGTHGAIVAGNELLKAYLVNFAPTFIYTTALPMVQLETIAQAHKCLETQPESHKMLHENMRYFQQKIVKENLNSVFSGDPLSPIQCLNLPQKKLVKISEEAQQNQIHIKPIYPPTVPPGQERIRIVLHSYNTPNEINQLIKIIRNHV